LFQYLYERYTPNFGYYVSKPDIVTACKIKQQSISQDKVNVTIFNTQVFKSRREQEFAHALSVTFTMEYQSRSQYDISNYNTLFKDYVNQNTTKVATDMALIGLPIVGADQVIMVRLNLLVPTVVHVGYLLIPCQFVAPPPTSEPTTANPVPTALPSMFPSEMPTVAPSKKEPGVDVVSQR
jgi:hypothetical protein